MVNGYSFLFDNDSCIVSDKKSGQTVAIVPMTQKNMFPLNVSNIVKNVVVAKGVNETQLWHLRYGHLNINGLKLLTRKNMVVGLPKVGDLELCEGLHIWKTKERASSCLELVHADLGGPMKLSHWMGVGIFFCLLMTASYELGLFSKVQI